MKKIKEKIIHSFCANSGQIVILSNKGKLYCEERKTETPTGKWFEVKNPFDNKELLLK